MALPSISIGQWTGKQQVPQNMGPVGSTYAEKMTKPIFALSSKDGQSSTQQKIL